MTYDLDPAQKAAVLHNEGPALVLAGPGSGKTTVITKRAVRLAGGIVKPERLLCVTFTNAAADEMRERFLKLYREENSSGEIDKTPVFATVHSFCNGIIKEYEEITGKRYTRIEGEDSPRNVILSRIYRKYNGSVPDDAMLERLKGYFRKEKDMLKAEEAGDNDNDAKASRPSGANQVRRFKEIAGEYSRIKAEKGYIDFDDMVFYALTILNENAQICEKIRGSFDYIQVDEAQDLSRAQYEVIRKISANGNIFIVADDDQSIYGFRGAEPQCLFDFVEEFPETARYALTRNFRSTPEIVEASAALVSVNKKRFDKHLYTTKEHIDASFCMKTHRDDTEQAFFCVREAEESAMRGESMAVLYRNGISSLPVRAAMLLKGIPFACEGNCPLAWDQTAVRECVMKILERERNARLVVPGPSSIFRDLIRAGFSDKMEEQCRLEGHDLKTVSVTVDFLRLLTKNTDSYRSAVRLLDRIDRKTCMAGSPGAQGPAVTLSTIHSAKGLEYDKVIVIDVLEGELPGNEAAGDAVEEERRLLYVAMTRARKYLILSRPLKRGMRGEEDSRFLKEIRMAKSPDGSYKAA